MKFFHSIISQLVLFHGLLMINECSIMSNNSNSSLIKSIASENKNNYLHSIDTYIIIAIIAIFILIVVTLSLYIMSANSNREVKLSDERIQELRSYINDFKAIGSLPQKSIEKK